MLNFKREMTQNLATLLIVCLSITGQSQEIGYHVFGTLTHPYAGKYFVMTLDTLNDAKTLEDVYYRYPSSWISEYRSVELTSTCGENVRRAMSMNDILTAEQMAILRSADLGCRIDVVIDYIPKNSLKDNPPKRENFSLTPIPIIEAKYPGGLESLQTFLSKEVVEEAETKYGAALKYAEARFNVDQDGNVSDIFIMRSSGFNDIDQLIQNTIHKMPMWTPARDREGKAIRQEFQFTIGSDLLRCDYDYVPLN